MAEGVEDFDLFSQHAPHSGPAAAPDTAFYLADDISSDSPLLMRTVLDAVLSTLSSQSEEHSSGLPMAALLLLLLHFLSKGFLFLVRVSLSENFENWLAEWYPSYIAVLFLDLGIRCLMFCRRRATEPTEGGHSSRLPTTPVL